MFKGGKLKFKGDEDGSVKKKSKKDKKKDKKEKKRKKERGEEEIEPEIITGSGRLVTSGKNVNGMETLFKDECEIGDTLIVQHPVSLVHEQQAITGILSQRSMSIDENFSQDLVSTMAFQIRKDGEALRKKAERDAEKDGEVFADLGQDEVSKRLQKQLKKKLKAQPRVVHIRQKTGMWGYKTITKVLDDGVTAEEALNARAKGSHDHWCQ